MAEFKIGLGIELENNAREKLNNIIDDIQASNPKVKINVDTTSALKKIKELIV